MSNREQVSPDELTAENELICEKLLGWEVRPRFGNNPCGLFFPDGRIANGPYSFTTWAEAGLILDAFTARGCDYDIESTTTDTGPRCTFRVFDIQAARYTRSLKRECDGQPMAAIRSAALAYIRSLP